jgi:hypothetical protein
MVTEYSYEPYGSSRRGQELQLQTGQSYAGRED